MATSKKKPAAAPVKDEAAVLAADKPAAARPAEAGAAEPAVAKPAATKAAVAKAAAAKKPAPAAKSAAKAAKPLDSAVQASKEALARALAAAQAVKIETPLGKPEKAEKAAKPGKEAKEVKEARVVKPKKPKLVRDSFTMPEDEYARLAELKKRLLGKGSAAKKSELLRAGIALLASLDDGALVAAMAKVEVIKTGRPAKSGK